MKQRKLLAVALIALMTILMTACPSSPLTPAQYKQIITVGFDTFIAAEAIYNPTWPTATIKDLGDKAIAAWGVGASWQTNVLAELTPAVAIVQSIPQCDNRCQAASLVFEGALTAVIIYLEAQAPPAGLAAAGPPPRPNVTVYKSYDEYKKAWNKQAPPSAKIQ